MNERKIVKQLFLEAGKVRNTHALRGEVKFECYLDGEKPLRGIRHLYLSPKGEKSFEIRSVRVQGDVLLVKFDGVDSVEAASLLKGKTMYASREELDPDGTLVFFADLIGLPLIEEGEGTVYGTIRDVGSRGAGELFTVLLPDGREMYFPVVKEWIVSMDAENGVFVHAPKGIFD